ncbi:acyl-CoA thioesterase [Sphingomonas carotinifaciens]|uniref:Acyl-CoA thioester hydrolase n=1 Tax=Sphingomonas carotinifaciens TaxID=1166323 RepID=A0A1G7MAJ4_9SPHN|nr:thioesterase family protein [Sphingomonas carotinifaciens]MBB4086892.1 acyl-CoA thioester hydrolase [Sphingomonas carotinifaciens]MWC42093.1 acyl-CoA thioesterase [Sphingomonas carotinifaciens]SDF58751.1 acyl-CoA thioester hydrolase [Sphingomonas carotinifaciens]
MARETLRPRTAYRWWQPIVTRWSDNDAYGHVNNAIYYHWFDTAVNNWLIAAGLLDVAHGDPIGLVVETQCRYARSVAYPEPVEIGVMLDRLGTSSVTYRLGAFVSDVAEAAAEALFTHVYVDRATRRPVPLPGAWRERLETLR